MLLLVDAVELSDRYLYLYFTAMGCKLNNGADDVEHAVLSFLQACFGCMFQSESNFSNLSAFLEIRTQDEDARTTIVVVEADEDAENGVLLFLLACIGCV